MRKNIATEAHSRQHMLEYGMKHGVEVSPMFDTSTRVVHTFFDKLLTVHSFVRYNHHVVIRNDFEQIIGIGGTSPCHQCTYFYTVRMA